MFSTFMLMSVTGRPDLVSPGAGGDTAPAQFGAGDWSVADDATGGDITITISALPSDGGSAITNLEYQIDGGAWVSLGGTATGVYAVSGLVDDVEVDVTIRAVNAVGDGTASATKSVTPTGAPDIGSVIWATAASDTTPGFSFDLPVGAVAGDVLKAEKSADGAGVWTEYFAHTLTGQNIIDDAITVNGVDVLSAGAYDFRFRLERGADLGDWSATVDVTISTASALLLENNDNLLLESGDLILLEAA